MKSLGHNVILVSSGAVGCGRHVLRIKDPPKTLEKRQALAAIGQVHLMSKYELMFAALSCNCAQVLITYDTFRNREHFVNAGNTIKELFKLNVIPVVNENDTVATQELRSENDTMSAMVASMVSADYLFLLTDVEGLFTSNPKLDPNAKLVKVIDSPKTLEVLLESLELKGGSTWGSGGMSVKINAASLASSLGIQTTILSAKKIDLIKTFINSTKTELIEPETGTTFLKNENPPSKRKAWIKGLRCVGSIILDSGASKAALKGHDIHAVGIIKVERMFPAMSVIKICSENEEIGIGICNYSTIDINSIIGLRSKAIENSQVVFKGPVVFRKNLVISVDKSNLEEKDEKQDNFFTSFET